MRPPSAPNLTADDAKLLRPIAEASAATSTDVVFLISPSLGPPPPEGTGPCKNELSTGRWPSGSTRSAPRKELAGVLAAAGRYQEAAGSLSGPDPGCLKSGSNWPGCGEATVDFAVPPPNTD